MTAARLFVLTATGTDAAVVLRRGPSSQVASLLWTRGDDTFEMGQWLNARIYEHRSDVSPDGRHMIYFANKGATVGGYSVVSRAPWFRAQVYLPQGTTWHGGGGFTSSGEVFMNGSTLPSDLPDGLQPAPENAFPHSTDGFHMGDLFAALMVRRGWRRSEAGGYDVRLWRDLENGGSIEMRVVQGRKDRGLVSLAYAFLAPDGKWYDWPDWTWAERWKDGIHFASEGALWFARPDSDGRLTDKRCIRDFNVMAFEALPAPYEGVVS